MPSEGGSDGMGSAEQGKQFGFAEDGNAQGIGFFQLAARGFSGDDVVGFFGHAAGHFAACGFD